MRPLLALFVIASACASGCSSVEEVVVAPGECLVLIALEGTPPADPHRLAQEGERGIRETVLTAGRHRIDGAKFRYERHPLVDVSPGRPPRAGGPADPGAPPEIGIRIALVGREPESGELLAAPGEKGIEREVLTPGRYAINPYAHGIEKHEATVVPPGCVGVVTRLVGALPQGEFAQPGERGVQRDVLAPGIWFLNPYEHSVAVLRVGYRELSFEGDRAVAFPSSDSYPIRAEATIVFGFAPQDAPYLIQRYGSEANLIDRVVRPQAESAIRTAGSDLSAHDFVVGDARRRFQDSVQASLEERLAGSNVHVLLALMRDIVVPQSVRKPIQIARIDAEETLTNQAIAETLDAKKQLAAAKVHAHHLVAGVQETTLAAIGEARARIEAERAQIESEIEIRIARFEAELATARAANAERIALAASERATAIAQSEARAEARLVELFGDSAAYATWRFAFGLTDQTRLTLRSGSLRRPRETRESPEYPK
jgi:hypothetical protein